MKKKKSSYFSGWIDVVEKKPKKWPFVAIGLYIIGILPVATRYITGNPDNPIGDYILFCALLLFFSALAWCALVWVTTLFTIITFSIWKKIKPLEFDDEAKADDAREISVEMTAVNVTILIIIAAFYVGWFSRI